jgi:SpoVK/Ycf46/Vps4 family AAA+-type ATPase
MALEEFGTDIDGDNGNCSTHNSKKGQQCDPSVPTSSGDEKVFRPQKTQWALCGTEEYVGIQKTQQTLNAGVYRVMVRNGEFILYRTNVNVDDLLEFPDSVSDSIIKEIGDFWNKAELFKQYGFLHRRGYLLYGPAGGGKTSLVQQIIKKIIDRNGLVFLCDHPSTLSSGLKIFREIEPNRNIICIFEDLDSIIETHGEDEILSILDGEAQVDKVLNIATTNYPENLDRRLVGRPRRFDRVIKIGMPNNDVRRLYFTKKLSITDAEAEIWVKKTDGFSFAAMAELVISVKCLGNDLDTSVRKLRDLLESKPRSSDDGKAVGFSVK